MLSNFTFDRGSLCLTYAEPIDLFVQGNKNGNWLGAWDSNQEFAAASAWMSSSGAAS